MKMLRRAQALAVGALYISMISGFAHAETLTVPSDRTSKQILQSNFGGIASMKPCKGNAPIIPALKNPPTRKFGFAGAAIGMPGASAGVPLDQLSQFLQLGLTQSYNKTYEQGYSILSTNITQARTAFGALPTGLRLALQSASEASGGRSYETAYKVLHEAMKEVANNPGEFANDPRTAYAAYLRLGRLSTYQKSYEEGYAILVKYLSNLSSQGADLIGTQELRTALTATINSSGGLTYQAAWETLEAGCKVMETCPTGPLSSFYFRMATTCAANKSYEHGYKIVMAFIDASLASGLLQPFERLSLDTSRQASGGKTYQAAWEILRDACNALSH